MKVASCFGIAVLSAVCVAGAQSPQPMPRDYRGVQVHVDGIWVTPIPNAPFTATVEIVSHETLPNGSQHVVKTINHIARSSAGVIRNERRQLVPVTFAGEPRLLSVHLYDPNSRRNTYFDPLTHLAREATLPTPPQTPVAQLAPEVQARIDTARGITIADLGTQRLDGVELHGTRKTRSVPGPASGTGAAVVITDDYWYSPDLHLYLIVVADDQIKVQVG